MILLSSTVSCFLFIWAILRHPFTFSLSVSLFLECVSCRWSICCSCLVAQSCLTVTPWTAAHEASWSFTVSQTLFKLMSIESVVPSNHLIFCHLLFLLPLIFPSIRVFSNESVLCIRWLKYWSFNFSISPSKEYSGPISFRMDWFDLLAVQGTHTITIQHNHQFSPVQLLSHVQLFETYGLQHAKPPCPSPTPGVYPNSCPLS